jgi:hypothetical protein
MQRIVPRKSAGFSSARSAGDFFPQIPQIEFPQIPQIAFTQRRKVNKGERKMAQASPHVPFSFSVAYLLF